MPLFSIITIVRNDSAGLRKTAASVAAQTCRDFEWLVIDGASTDGTADVALALADKGARVISEPDRGIYDAMNKGVARAAGEYLVFMNAGDTFAGSETLTLVQGNLSGRPNLLYGDAQEAFGGQQLVYKVARGHGRVGQGMFACHQSMYFHRPALAGKGYDTSFKLAGDYALAARVVRAGGAVQYLAQPLAVFDLQGLSNNRRALGRHENWVVQRDILGVPLLARCLNRLRYWVSAFLTTRMPALYNRLRYTRRPA